MTDLEMKKEIDLTTKAARYLINTMGREKERQFFLNIMNLSDEWGFEMQAIYNFYGSIASPGESQGCWGGSYTSVYGQLQVAKRTFAHLLKLRGFTISPHSKRDLKNLSKKIKIPLQDLKDFIRPYIQEIIDEILGPARPELSQN